MLVAVKHAVIELYEWLSACCVIEEIVGDLIPIDMRGLAAVRIFLLDRCVVFVVPEIVGIFVLHEDPHPTVGLFHRRCCPSHIHLEVVVQIATARSVKHDCVVGHGFHYWWCVGRCNRVAGLVDTCALCECQYGKECNALIRIIQ